MMLALLASVACVAVHVWANGLNDSNDGRRYTSWAPQPPPFHRRFRYWPAPLLKAVTLLSLVALGVAMGSWTKAAMLLLLPGAWFIATHPTTTDAPCMLLGWTAAHLMPTQPYVAVLLSIVAGVIHERGPVFAAVYAMHPLLLLGLLGVQWWAKPAARDDDRLVGHGFIDAIKAHRPYQDLLDGRIVALGLRGVLAQATWHGASPRAWLALAVAFGSRIIGTDTCRFLFWAAPPLVADAQEPALWLLAAHAVTFRRAI